MPRGDATGPAGTGPITGRRAGYCRGFGTQDYTSSSPRYGFGRGFFRTPGFFCRNRGWRLRFRAHVTPGWMNFGAPDTATEMQMLKDEAEALASELGAIRKRLETIDPEPEQK